MQTFFTYFFALLILPFLVINAAYPLSQVWNMFMPLIGFPTITIPIAIGLTMLHAYFWRTTYYNNMEEDQKKTAIRAIFKPWISLLVAWIAFQFVDVKTKAVQDAVPAEPAVPSEPVPAHSTATPELE